MLNDCFTLILFLCSLDGILASKTEFQIPVVDGQDSCVKGQESFIKTGSNGFFYTFTPNPRGKTGSTGFSQGFGAT